MYKGCSRFGSNSSQNLNATVESDDDDESVFPDNGIGSFKGGNGEWNGLHLRFIPSSWSSLQLALKTVGWFTNTMLSMTSCLRQN